MKQNKTIYLHVRCETKHCDNNFKLLKIPKILAGKQKCQICKYVMKKVNVNKNIEVVERKIKPEEMKDFIGCFLTGTAAEITPVSLIAENKFKVTDLIKDLSESYQALVRKKTAA